MENKTLSKAAAMAQFRLAVIAPVIHGLYPDASRNAYYERITGNPFTLPDGSVVRYSPGTISKWVAQYQNGGIEALMPRERADKGGTRVLPDTAIEEIHRLKQAFPRLNATQIYRQLVEEGFIPATVSVCAVQRYIKHNDLKSARNPNLRDRKAFEEDAFGKLWQADTCYLPHITENGRRRRVYCIMIIDDHSRLLVGGGLFYNDTSYNFQKVLKAAIATYGIPMKLYVDNGSTYSNVQLSLICGSLGTVERYRATCNQIRRPESRQWLEDCFFNRVTRKVNKDSTVSIDKISYDVPMQFISSKVDIRFLPDDMSSAYILYGGAHYPIRRTDKVENCRTKRNNLPVIDYSKTGGSK